MFTTALDTSADLATTLLIHYSFDLNGYSANELVDRWQKQYPEEWLPLAVIEALYQGRYKAVSVHQILTIWQRRGQVTYHFNTEFERLICSKFPESLTSMSTPALPPASKTKSHQELRQQEATQPNYKDISTQPRQNSHAGDTEQPRVHQTFLTNFPKSHTLPSSLSPAPLPSKTVPLLPNTLNHPPIGQFTPETSGGSESFTSKLKAMSHDRLRPEGGEDRS